MVAGLEPAPFGLFTRRSGHLSYTILCYMIILAGAKLESKLLLGPFATEWTRLISLSVIFGISTRVNSYREHGLPCRSSLHRHHPLGLIAMQTEFPVRQGSLLLVVGSARVELACRLGRSSADLFTRTPGQTGPHSPRVILLKNVGPLLAPRQCSLPERRNGWLTWQRLVLNEDGGQRFESGI